MVNRSGLISSLPGEILLRDGVSITGEGVGRISEWIYGRLGVFSVFKATGSSRLSSDGLFILALSETIVDYILEKISSLRENIAG